MDSSNQGLLCSMLRSEQPIEERAQSIILTVACCNVILRIGCSWWCYDWMSGAAAWHANTRAWNPWCSSHVRMLLRIDEWNPPCSIRHEADDGLMMKIYYSQFLLSGFRFLKNNFSFLKNVKKRFLSSKNKSYIIRTPRSGFIIIMSIFFYLKNTRELVIQARTRNKWFQPRRSREPQKRTT